MQQRNKMIRLATHHFFQMGKFLFPLYALLLTGEVLVSSRMFVQSCRMGALLSFQAIWWKPILPVMFYVAYAVAFFGILLYFMRFTMGGTKGVYTLRSLPTGAEGLAGSMLLAVLWAFLLLWAVQIVAVYVSYGVYHWETALYNLPGARVGTSKLGFSVLLPDSPWAPPANDLYLTFVRTPFLQMFYPRHLFFVLLLASFLLLPVASCVYLALSFYGRRWWAAIPAAAAWASLFAATSMGESSLGQWDISACIFLAFEVAYMAACTVWMLGMAYRLCRKSLLD